MGAYILRRLLLIIPTLFGIMLIHVSLTQMVPGGPIEQVAARLEGEGDSLEAVSGGGDAGAEQQAQREKPHHRDGGLHPFRRPRAGRFRAERTVQHVDAARPPLRLDQHQRMFCRQLFVNLNARRDVPVAADLALSGFLHQQRQQANLNVTGDMRRQAQPVVLFPRNQRASTRRDRQQPGVRQNLNDLQARLVKAGQPLLQAGGIYRHGVHLGAFFVQHRPVEIVHLTNQSLLRHPREGGRLRRHFLRQRKVAEDHLTGGQQQTHARSQRMVGKGMQRLRGVQGCNLFASRLTPHDFPVLTAVGTNKKDLFHSVLLFLFNHSVTTLPRHNFTGFVIHLKLAHHAKR